MRQWMINLPDQDLAYLPQGNFEDYVRAVHWAQDYALANRDLMMRNMIAAVQGSGEVPAFEANVEVVRNTYLRNYTDCPEGIYKYSMGHGGKI